MKKNYIEVIIIAILLIIFVKVGSPQIIKMTEKSRAAKAKMFLQTILKAEVMYKSMWSEYTDNIESLSEESPEISKWIVNPDWSFDLESDKKSFIFTLTRLSNNPNYSGKTLAIDQAGKIFGGRKQE